MVPEPDQAPQRACPYSSRSQPNMRHSHRCKWVVHYRTSAAAVQSRRLEGSRRLRPRWLVSPHRSTNQTNRLQVRQRRLNRLRCHHLRTLRQALRYRQQDPNQRQGVFPTLLPCDEHCRLAADGFHALDEQPYLPFCVHAFRYPQMRRLPPNIVSKSC